MHVVNEGDTPKLRWSLGRDLTGTTQVRVLIREDGATAALALANTGAVDGDATDGVVSLQIAAADWDVGKLEPNKVYRVKVETTHPDLGVLTHPNTYSPQSEILKTISDLE